MKSGLFTEQSSKFISFNPESLDFQFFPKCFKISLHLTHSSSIFLRSQLNLETFPLAIFSFPLFNNANYPFPFGSINVKKTQLRTRHFLSKFPANLQKRISVDYSKLFFRNEVNGECSQFICVRGCRFSSSSSSEIHFSQDGLRAFDSLLS